ncbi:SMP-30/gluconolactonase/LRE family protein [Oricola sp.]|uniref:SMP-30/gluconolactonase/LRE family protein n=1 Tax=Oricola sp. TaxID=1979950 RepID=UPI0025D9B34D|nr:SMP-30/gluconolactonase/LRE family protein [Oricola sp.]MCI5075089.1 SMP-30/gluconolactonase/LRE family protein [Oricola sp.]
MSARADIRVICDIRHMVGESPLWDTRAGCLWWVDAAGREVRRYEAKSGAVTTFAMPFPPSALALAQDGAVIVAAGDGWHRLDTETGEVSTIARIESAPEGTRMNDGVVDAAGRFWTGTMSTSSARDPVGGLYCLDGDRILSAVSGLRVQNGTAISPDGRTFYLADSHADVATIWAFDFDTASGTLSNRRVFHRPSRGRPDGAAVDAEGCYWFAAIDGGCIVRLDPDGKEMQAVELPVSRPTKPAFGGDGLSTLFITTMSLGLDVAAEPLAGTVLAIETEVRGFEQPHVTRIPAGSPARLDA